MTTHPDTTPTVETARDKISLHAIRRYLERIAGFQEEVAKAEAAVTDPTNDMLIVNQVLADLPITLDDINAHLCTPEVMFACSMGLSRYHSADMVYCFRNGCVTTVYAPEDLAQQDIEDPD